uniref:(northern house mosquito) hypothetical protein n=1 Tax=Culex pipiens TaxID=7175 RepID=A0A8D8BUY7_CULPI
MRPFATRDAPVTQVLRKVLSPWVPQQDQTAAANAEKGRGKRRKSHDERGTVEDVSVAEQDSEQQAHHPGGCHHGEQAAWDGGVWDRAAGRLDQRDGTDSGGDQVFVPGADAVESDGVFEGSWDYALDRA